MNKNLVQISNNFGVVSDENGEIKVVTKSETNCEFQNILLKENELENLNQELISAKRKLTENKANTLFGELGNLVIIGGGIFLSIELFPVVSTQLLIYQLIGTYAILKSIILAMYGTRIGRYKKNKKLKSSIETLEENSVQLEAELKKMKEKAKYSASCTEDKDLNPESYVLSAYHNSTLYSENNVNEKKPKVKVLSLTKKNNLYN